MMKTRLMDMHVHTSFSDGIHTVEENVLSALEKGMDAIGFSDHSYTYFDLTYCMREESLQPYIAEVRRVKECYKDQIEIYLGLEYDGYSQIDNRSDFDYIIGSCHYTMEEGVYRSVDVGKEYQQETIQLYHQGDSVQYAKKYFETYIQCVQKIRPDILGHMDLVVLFDNIDEESPVYRNAAKETMVAALEVSPVFELNTRSFIRRKRNIPYPSVEMLQEALHHNGKVILSSDSHCKETLLKDFEVAREILRQIGYKEIVVFENRQFREIGL